MNKTINIIIVILFLITNTILADDAYIKLSNLRIRNKPSLKSDVIAYMTENDYVFILDKSIKQDTIKIRNKKITDNWYKIKTLSGIEGWVFGGALEKDKKLNIKIDQPKISAFGHARIRRKSKNKNPKNKTWSLPPWDTIKIIQGSYYLKEPVIGSKVTIVSKEGFIPSFNSKILKMKKRLDCDNCEQWWEIDLEQIIHPAWKFIRGNTDHVMEYPSDLFIIFPAINYAQVISKDLINNSDLPSDLNKQLIVTAIDTTGNKKPDIVEYTYSCSDTSNLNKKSWDYQCTNVYIKKNNKWILIRNFKPM